MICPTETTDGTKTKALPTDTVRETETTAMTDITENTTMIDTIEIMMIGTIETAHETIEIINTITADASQVEIEDADVVAEAFTEAAICTIHQNIRQAKGLAKLPRFRLYHLPIRSTLLSHYHKFNLLQNKLLNKHNLNQTRQFSTPSAVKKENKHL